MKETSSTADLFQRAFGWCKDAKASCEYTPEWPPELESRVGRERPLQRVSAVGTP